MTCEYQIRVVPEVAAQEYRLKAWLADEYGFDVRTIFGVRILKRSKTLKFNIKNSLSWRVKGTILSGRN